MTIRSRHHQPRTDPQRQEKTPQRHIERRRRLLQIHVLGSQIRTRCCIHSIWFTIARCVTATPFGRPVEPDVKITYAVFIRPHRRTRSASDTGAAEYPDTSTVSIDHDRPLHSIEPITRASRTPRRLRGVQHIRDTLGRMIRIDRNPRPTRPHDRIHTDHQIQRTTNRQTHQRLRPNTHRNQVLRKLIHPSIELRHTSATHPRTTPQPHPETTRTSTIETIGQSMSDTRAQCCCGQ